MKTRGGVLEIRTGDGTLAYRGEPDSNLIDQNFAEEQPLIRDGIMRWLRSVGVFGSQWNSFPINCRQLAPTAKPRR